jgi:tetratricopeptide (TPR) repeat protein
MRRSALILAFAFLCLRPLAAHPEIDEALARLNLLLAAAPGNPALYLQRGELYARHDDPLTAEANFLRAAELSPREPGLAKARGALAVARGDFKPAEDHLTIALTDDPRDAEALVLRSRVRARLHRRLAALADLDAALALLALPPPDLYLDRAALLDSPADAIGALDAGLARLGPVPALLEQALRLEESAGLTDAAVARIDRVIAQSERPEIWLKRRGDVLQHAGRHPEAAASYAAARHRIEELPSWLQHSPATSRLLAEITTATTTLSRSP